jgi:hypothetical protein
VLVYLQTFHQATDAIGSLLMLLFVYKTKCCVQVKVRVRVIFMKIDYIDTTKDKYSAEILLQSKWHDPSLDSTKSTVS